MGIDATIARQFALDVIIEKANKKKELKDRLHRDMLRVYTEMKDLRRQEAELERRLSLAVRFSAKWWHLLGALDMVVRDQIEGRRMAEEFKAMTLAIDNGTVGAA